MSSKQGPKGGPAAAAKSKKAAKPGAEEKRDDHLQAVVLADDFQDRFKPFTLEKPRCLLPLAGSSLIDWTLEFLAHNGVDEVFLYCGAHSEEIETYIHRSSRWSPGAAFKSIDFIRVSDAHSVGDFLRDLDKRSLITGDFIFVHGDLVANIALDDALRKHRERREANRDACMTIVLRSIGDAPHRAKEARVVDPVFVIDPHTGRCLHYDETHPLQDSSHMLMDPIIFEFGETEIRADVIDAGIDICTPEVLALWSESFDYQLPRKNFLHGVLKDHELNGKMIYTEIFDTGYAARASSLSMYDCLSKDVLGGWTSPFSPESNLVHGQSFRRNNTSLKEDNVLVSKGCRVRRSVLGKNTTVAEGTTICKSIIGRRCKIGKNVKIEDSYIWDDTTIGDDSTVSRSVLATDVVIGRGCQITPGSLISYGVCIDNNIQLPPDPAPRISLLTYDKTPATTNTALVGPGGRGALFEEEEEDGDEDEADRNPAPLERTLFFNLEKFNISSDSISTFASEHDYESDSDRSSRSARSRRSSFTSNDSALSSDAFHNEAVHGLLDALRADDNDDFDSAKLEFMGLRLGNNASDSQVRRAIAVAFARYAAELLTPEHGGLEPTKAAEKAFTSKKGAIKFIREVGVGSDKREVQAEFALSLHKALVGVRGLEVTRAGTLLAAMLQQLYNLDVLEEDGILEWWGDSRASENENLTKVKEKCRVLVEWLENADEEESGEDSD